MGNFDSSGSFGGSTGIGIGGTSTPRRVQPTGGNGNSNYGSNQPTTGPSQWQADRGFTGVNAVGGKSAPAPKPTDPMESARAQMAIDDATAARNATSAAAERDRQAQEAQRVRDQTGAAVNTAYTTGQGYGTQKAGSLGFQDTYGLLDSYNAKLNAARGGVPETAGNNVGSYFNYDDLWNKSMNEATTAQSTKLDNAYRGIVKPGWENSYFADTADDSILDSILGEQYSGAFDTIDAARARGQLSQGAFDNTLRGLDAKKAGARSQLEDTGLGVLGGYRGQLDDVSKQYSDQIGSYKLGQNISMDDMLAAFGSKRDTLTGRLGGDIRNAVGDTNYFNTDTLMAKGNSAAGVSNNPLRDAFKDSTTIDPTRTTGTTGVF